MKTLFFSLLVLFLSAPVRADEHAAHRHMMEKKAGTPDDMNVEVRLHDLELVDQYGKPVRFLFSGVREQLRALVDFAVEELWLSNPRVAVLAPAGERYEDLHAAVEQQCRRHGWASETGVALLAGRSDPSAVVRRLASEGTDFLFLLDSREISSLLTEAAKIGWRPRVFLPAGTSAGRGSSGLSRRSTIFRPA